ncbi:MAG: KTSC domain-containing protein [Chloroflexi bacterium]|nr:KTSC domain-containing protein [Chloroflexota bacterium]
MERIPVASTTMSSMGYDLESRTLEIEFVGGAIYQYFDVPEEIYQGLLSAESKGRYFNLVIKPLGFEYQQL